MPKLKDLYFRFVNFRRYVEKKTNLLSQGNNTMPKYNFILLIDPVPKGDVTHNIESVP